MKDASGGLHHLAAPGYFYLGVRRGGHTHEHEARGICDDQTLFC